MSAEAIAEKEQGRRPESVIVLIFRPDGHTLMLERADWPGFWQSVTGGVEWGESHVDAARRELAEETGLQPLRIEDRLITRRFEIFPEYRHKYPPHIRFNNEREFIVWVEQDAPVVLSAREHSAYCWLPPAQAIVRTPSWTNRQALRMCLAEIDDKALS